MASIEIYESVNRTLYYHPVKYDATKLLMRFDIPEVLRGATITSALLALWADSADGYLGSVVAKSNIYTDWDDTTGYATLAAMGLSAGLETRNLIPGSMPMKVTWNVLGDSTKGMIQAAEAEVEKVTFALVCSGTAPDRSDGEHRIGSDDDGNLWRFWGSDSETYRPRVEIEYEAGEPGTIWAARVPLGWTP